MSVVPLDEFTSFMPEFGRVIALDVGSRTIGIAYSDAMRQLASPADTIRRTKFKQDALSIVDVCEREKVAGIVIGYPLNMDGTEGPRCQSTRAFARSLEEYIMLPMCFWDERMSSQEAEDAMLATDMSRQKRAQKIDKVAAALFLQGFLDALND